MSIAIEMASDDIDMFERLMALVLRECIEGCPSEIVAEWDLGKPSYGGYYIEGFDKVYPLGAEQTVDAVARVADMDIVTLAKVLSHVRPVYALSEAERGGLIMAIHDWEEST